MKEKFTLEEVKEILNEVYERYNIQDHKLFTRVYLSEFMDEPDEEEVVDAINRDIESFLY